MLHTIVARRRLPLLAFRTFPVRQLKVFGLINEAKVNLDMIVQNVPTDRPNVTDISFTLDQAQGDAALKALKAAQAELGFRRLFTTSRLVSCRWLARV